MMLKKHSKNDDFNRTLLVFLQIAKYFFYFLYMLSVSVVCFIPSRMDKIKIRDISNMCRNVIHVCAILISRFFISHYHIFSKHFLNSVLGKIEKKNTKERGRRLYIFMRLEMFSCVFIK
jgi:hypothetical protein